MPGARVVDDGSNCAQLVAASDAWTFNATDSLPTISCAQQALPL
jgi:hypothetical protein